MDPTALAHYQHSALLALERGRRLDQWLKRETGNGLVGAPWRIDPHVRTLTFADAQPMRFEVLATVDASDQSLVWSWANPSVENPALTAQASRFRDRAAREAVEILTRETVSTAELDPLIALAIAVDWCDADVGYCARHGDGAMLLLLEDQGVVSEPGYDATSLVADYTVIIRTLPVDHRLVLEAWLDRTSRPYNKDEYLTSFQLSDAGLVRARFDPLNRCVEFVVSGNQGGD
ncbi:MAG: hypothetical protein R3B57_10125 [Phycisphaerales bacterium]